MNISRENYMIWISDFYDGTLSDTQEEALHNFLDLNPDLKEEFASFSDIKVHPDISRRLDKTGLKKDIYDLDPDLSPEEFDLITKKYGSKKLFEESATLKLKPQAIEFPFKRSLKRIPLRSRLLFYSSRTLAAAASIAIIVSLFIIVPGNNTSIESYTSSGILPFNRLPEEPGQRLYPVLSENRIAPKEIKLRPVQVDPDPQPEVITTVTPRETIEISPASYSSSVYIASNETPQSTTLAIVNETEVPVDYPDLSPRQFVAMNFRKMLLDDEGQNTEKLKVHEVADGGINGLNKLLGWEMQFEKETDEEGRLKSYKFTSQLFNLDRKTKIADE